MEPDTSRLRSIGADFAPAKLASTLIVGLVSGVILVTLTISVAALVFKGDLRGGLPLGVGLSLFGTVVIGIVAVFGSGLDGAVAGVQDNTSAIIGVAAVTMVAGVTVDQAVPTVIALIVVTSVLTGAALFGLGVFRLGGLVRYVPFPVVGGFLVATGILILDGARTILLDGSDLLASDSVWLWAPGVGFAVLTVLLGRRDGGARLLPWVIAASIAVFHVGRVVADIDVDEAAARGWLIGGLDGEALWKPDVLRVLGDADWGAVAGEWAAIATVIALAAISLIIKVHALDQATGVDIDVDRELTVAGVSTALAASGGGMPGFMHTSQTMLLRQLAGPRRGPALVAVVLNGVVLLAGGTILRLVPTAVVGGLLAYLGVNFVVDWVWDARSRLHRSDYALVIGAGVAVVAFGFLPAIALGTGVAIVLFVVRYSRVEAVRHVFTLATFRGTFERPAEHVELLAERGGGVVVLEVHGFLFFGTAYRVFNDPRIDAGGTPLVSVVFDLSRVTGLDSSASTTFAKLARRAAAEGFGIAVAGTPPGVEQLSMQLGDHADVVSWWPTLDAAVEWCEEGLLDGAVVDAHSKHLFDQLRDVLESDVRTVVVLRYFERHAFSEGEVVLAQGQESAGLLFIESGSLTARLATGTGDSVRLRTMQAGTLVGEISLYLGGATTASVVAEEPSSVLVLSPARLRDIEKSDPEAAAAVHRIAAQTLADRVLHAERTLRTFRGVTVRRVSPAADG